VTKCTSLVWCPDLNPEPIEIIAVRAFRNRRRSDRGKASIKVHRPDRDLEGFLGPPPTFRWYTTA